MKKTTKRPVGRTRKTPPPEETIKSWKYVNEAVPISRKHLLALLGPLLSLLQVSMLRRQPHGGILELCPWCGRRLPDDFLRSLDIRLGLGGQLGEQTHDDACPWRLLREGIRVLYHDKTTPLADVFRDLIKLRKGIYQMSPEVLRRLEQEARGGHEAQAAGKRR